MEPKVASPGARANGAGFPGVLNSALVRSVRFILNRHMDENQSQQHSREGRGSSGELRSEVHPQTGRVYRACGTATSMTARDDLHQARKRWSSPPLTGQSSVPHQFYPAWQSLRCLAGWAFWDTAARTPAAHRRIGLSNLAGMHKTSRTAALSISQEPWPRSPLHRLLPVPPRSRSRVHRHQPWQRFFPAPPGNHVGKNSSTNFSSRTGEVARPFQPGPARDSRGRGSTTCSWIGAMRASITSGRPTESPTAFMPPWR